MEYAEWDDIESTSRPPTKRQRQRLLMLGLPPERIDELSRREAWELIAAFDEWEFQVELQEIISGQLKENK
ncbi:MAG: hypothetical protein CL946_06280 [Ectothiorhodospiraceae bacterium]|nr:hypothetical protein [Ectothiorhodospiraceae bacterium]